jgi:hypothetical protein
MATKDKPPGHMLRQGLDFAIADLVDRSCASMVCDLSCFVLWITDAFSVLGRGRQQIVFLP